MSVYILMGGTFCVEPNEESLVAINFLSFFLDSFFFFQFEVNHKFTAIRLILPSDCLLWLDQSILRPKIFWILRLLFRIPFFPLPICVSTGAGEFLFFFALSFFALPKCRAVGIDRGICVFFEFSH